MRAPAPLAGGRLALLFLINGISLLVRAVQGLSL